LIFVVVASFLCGSLTALQGESLSITEAMQDCIAAGRRPREVLPSFVPIEQGIPTTPTRIIVPEEEPLRFQ
jgi:hypothetical protein